MIQTSSKRLSKIKKKLKKNDTSDYYFLVSSLQRQSNKQNYSSNQLNHNKTSLKNSIQLVKPAMINSFDNYKHQLNESIDNRHCSKIKLKNNPVPFFQNVKFLKNSRILEQTSQQPQNKFILSKKKYQNNRELSQNIKAKQINESQKNQKSNKLIESNKNLIQQKFEAYIQFVNEYLEDLFKNMPNDKSSSLIGKKCLLQTLGKQLLRQICKNIDNQAIKLLHKSIQVSNFSSYPSKGISRQLEKSINLKQKAQQTQYKKIIDDLSHENSKLTQLISEHERKNIKMFIQMNQNQSKEIQRCKKYLSTLYDKYKLLEKSLIKQNENYKKIFQQKEQLQKNICQLKIKNQQLSNELQRIKGILDQMSNQTVSKLSFEEQSYNTIFNFNINEGIQRNKQNIKSIKNNQSTSQNSKIDKSFVTKRDKAYSCLSTHLNADIKNKQESMMSCSTIIKNKNMKKKKNKHNIGINLNDKFNNTVENESIILSLRKQLETIKQKLNEQVVIKLALQKQLCNLEINLNKKNQKTQRMQAIINEQISQIQKLMQLNSKLSNQFKIHQINSKSLNKQNKKISQNQLFEKLKLIKQTKNNSTLKDFKYNSVSALMQTEYRVIAMQANLLQQLINFS